MGLAPAGLSTGHSLRRFRRESAFGVLRSGRDHPAGSLEGISCALIFATERLLEEINPQAKGSPLFKRLTPAEVRPMLRPKPRRFCARWSMPITALCPRPNGLRCPTREITEVVALAGGFPYLLMLGSREVWELRREQGLPARPRCAAARRRTRRSHESAGRDIRAHLLDLYYLNLSGERREVLLDLARRGVIPGQCHAGDRSPGAAPGLADQIWPR